MQRQPAQEPSRQPSFFGTLRELTSGRTWLWGLILALLVGIVYWPTLDGGLLSDDRASIADNGAMRSLGGLFDIWFKLDTAEQYYPLAFSTFWTEYQVWGIHARGYHAVNLLLHAAAVLLAWRLLVRLAVPGAWLAAALFAVHPANVESVARVIELRNMLSCVLALGSILAYLRFLPPEGVRRADGSARAARPGWGYYALSLGLYVASLLAKTATAAVPAVLLVIYWWKLGRLTWRDAVRTAPFFAIGLALCGITVWMETTYWRTDGPEWDFSLVERLLIAGRALSFYAGKLIWPHPLIWIHPRWDIDWHVWWQYLFPMAAVAVGVGLWLPRRRIGRGPLAAVLIFAGVLVPVLGFFNVFIFRYTFVSDHLQYHASIALIALAAAAAAGIAVQLPDWARWLGAVACAGLLLPLVVVARERTYVWKNELSVVEDTVAWNPYSSFAHYYLATLLRQQGKDVDAILHFRQAIELQEQLVRGKPTVGKYQDELAAYRVDIGMAQRAAGRSAAAESSFRKAIEIRAKLVQDYPRISAYLEGLAWCYVDLAMVQHETGKPAEAAASYRRSIEIRRKLTRDDPTVGKYPDQLAASYVDLGLVQRELGRPSDAENSFHEAMELRTKLVRDYPAVRAYQDGLAWCYVDLALVQHETGKSAEADASRRTADEIRARLARGNPTADGRP